jgi:hypothetical protein
VPLPFVREPNLPSVALWARVDLVALAADGRLSAPESLSNGG